MGGTLPLAGTTSAMVRLEVHVKHAARQTLEIVRNGEIAAIETIPSDDARLTGSHSLSTGQWIHVRTCDATGITALSNPVYAGSRRH
jgi:hypothetical protein